MDEIIYIIFRGEIFLSQFQVLYYVKCYISFQKSSSKFEIYNNTYPRKSNIFIQISFITARILLSSFRSRGGCTCFLDPAFIRASFDKDTVSKSLGSEVMMTLSCKAS